MCNEIWRRIAKYKHKFDETKNVCVTSWVGKVSINVIQTLRKKSMLYRSRNVSIEGMVQSGKNGEEIEVNMEKIIADNHDNTGQIRKLFYENILDCFEDFNETEKQIVKLFLESESENLVIENEKRIYKRNYASISFIKKKLNITQKEYQKCIKSIGEKYVARQERNPNNGIDNGLLHWIL